MLGKAIMVSKSRACYRDSQLAGNSYVPSLVGYSDGIVMHIIILM